MPLLDSALEIGAGVASITPLDSVFAFVDLGVLGSTSSPASLMVIPGILESVWVSCVGAVLGVFL